MRKEDIEKLSDTLQYNRARYRLTRTTNPDVIKSLTEIIVNFEKKYPKEIRKRDTSNDR